MQRSDRLVLRCARVTGDLSSVVEFVDGDRVAIAVPVGDGEEVQLLDREEIEIEWDEGEDTRIARALVLGGSDLPGGGVDIELLGVADAVQRRDNVRLPVTIPLTVWEIVPEDQAEPPPSHGTIHNLSGGGMRARVPRRLQPGDRFWVEFELPEEHGEVATEAVVRVHLAGDVYGFEFDRVSPADRERIIRTLFHLMRVQLARRSGIEL